METENQDDGSGNQNLNDKNKTPSGGNGSGNQGGAGGEGGDTAEFTSLEEANKAIKALRKENASRRTASKSQEDQLAALTAKLTKITGHLGLDDNEADPEEALTALQSQYASLEMDMAVMQMARTHNIPVQHDEYFKFLAQKRIAEFEASSGKDEELPEDFFEKIAEEVSQYASPKGSQRGSIGAGDGGSKKPAGSAPEMTAEQFSGLGIDAKIALKKSDPEKYKRLWDEAVSKRLIK